MRLKIVIGIVLFMFAIIVFSVLVAQYIKTKDEIIEIDNELLLTSEEVEKHNVKTDCWIIVSNEVYDLTSHIENHTGGSEKIIELCGKDGTVMFQTKGERGKDHSDKAYGILQDMRVGALGSSIPIQ